MNDYEDHETFDEFTGLQKFGDISVGDIVMIRNKNYIFTYDELYFEFVSMQNSDNINISKYTIVDFFVKKKAKLRSKIITEDSIKNCDTGISFNYDGSIKLSKNFLYTLEDEEQCNDTLMTYYPIEKKISQDSMSYNKVLSELLLEDKSVLRKLLPYKKFLSKSEQKILIDNLSIDSVTDIDATVTI